LEVLGFYKYVIAVVLGWFLAQLIKCVIDSVRYKRFEWGKVWFASGGMPSSHTATVTAVMTLIGLSEGLDSAVFGLAFAVFLIVAYDAMKARRSVGEQAELMGALLKEQQSNLQPPKVVRGHTVWEVVMGASLGILVGLGVFLLVS
jgi:acid phosphatase family membrane protein YuiD